MRILISYEESYRAYSDALERAKGGLHPDARKLIGVLRRTAAPLYAVAVVVAFAIFPAPAA